MKLPFGKYKGHDTQDPEVPTHYLAWLEEQDFIRPKMRADLQAELKNRSDNRPGAGKVVQP